MHRKSSRWSEIKNIKIIKFLEEYKRHNCLWNPKNDNYKNKSARDDAYEKIISALNITDLEVNDIKLKIKSIRTTYKKEVTLVNNASKDGQLYVPKLFWFEKAHSFLKHVLPPTAFDIASFKINKMESNHKSEECSSLIEYVNTTESDKDKEAGICNMQNFAESNNPKFETIESSYHDSEMDIQPSKNIENENVCKSNINPSRNLPNTEDDLELFCRSVAAQLRKISDPYSRSVAKFKIQQILFEAETGHYKKNVCITLPATQDLGDL